jgi:hypothetical protein
METEQVSSIIEDVTINEAYVRALTAGFPYFVHSDGTIRGGTTRRSAVLAYWRKDGSGRVSVVLMPGRRNSPR